MSGRLSPKQELQSLLGPGVEIIDDVEAASILGIKVSVLRNSDPKLRIGHYKRAAQSTVLYRRDWCEAGKPEGLQAWPSDRHNATLVIRRWMLEEIEHRKAQAHAGEGPDLNTWMPQVYDVRHEADVTPLVRKLFGASYSEAVIENVQEAWAEVIHEQKIALFDYAEGRVPPSS